MRLQEIFLKYVTSIVDYIPLYGGFQLLYLILPELKSHVIPYKFKSSHWLRANLVKDFFFTNEFSTNERT